MVAVAAMPLLLAFLFAAIDLGRVAFLGAEASTAAHAVCRCVEAAPSAAGSPDRLREAALEAAPSLGAAVEREIAYRLHDDEDGSFAVRALRARTRSVAVELTVRARYLTPLGSLLSEKGADPAFACTARACGSIDETARGEAA